MLTLCAPQRYYRHHFPTPLIVTAVCGYAGVQADVCPPILVYSLTLLVGHEVYVMLLLAYRWSAAYGQVPPSEMLAFTVLPFALSRHASQLLVII